MQEEESPPPQGTTFYYFLDQVSLNQHKFVDENTNQEKLQSEIVDALKSQMIRSGRILLCLHPWNRPIPLRRVWCLVRARCNHSLLIVIPYSPPCTLFPACPV